MPPAASRRPLATLNTDAALADGPRETFKEFASPAPARAPDAAPETPVAEPSPLMDSLAPAESPVAQSPAAETPAPAPVQAAPIAAALAAPASPAAAAAPLGWQQDVQALLMWKDVARSGLVFGAGCLLLASGWLAPSEWPVRPAALACYAALMHLAINFVRAVLRPAAATAAAPPAASPADYAWLADAAAAAHGWAAARHRALFGGSDPSITLAVALALWGGSLLLSVCSLYALATAAFVAAFAAPVLLQAHRARAEAAAGAAWAAVSARWAALPRAQQLYTAAGAAAAVIFLAPLATKAIIAFLLFVAFRKYQLGNSAEVARATDFVRRRTARVSMGLRGLLSPAPAKASAAAKKAE